MQSKPVFQSQLFQYVYKFTQEGFHTTDLNSCKTSWIMYLTKYRFNNQAFVALTSRLLPPSLFSALSVHMNRNACETTPNLIISYQIAYQNLNVHWIATLSLLVYPTGA